MRKIMFGGKKDIWDRMVNKNEQATTTPNGAVSAHNTVVRESGQG